MNFISTFDELNKLYEEELPKKKLNRACNEELIKTTPTVKTYTKDEARAIIEANDALLAEYESLLPYYEDGRIDHGFEYGNFFNFTDDESKIVIQWVISDTDSTELIVDSLEAAVVAIRDIEASEGALVGTEIWRDEKLTEAAEDEVHVEEVPVEDPVAEEEPRQVICECDKCGALVIKDEADIVVDEETDLVNVEDECQFCEEAKGFKIIGVVAPYEPAVEEAPVEDVVEESLNNSELLKEIEKTNELKTEHESEYLTLNEEAEDIIDEDLADLYRKTFDKPASTKTQQRWEDELNGEMGEISDKRRAHLERKFAQQRDWEARHEADAE